MLKLKRILILALVLMVGIGCSNKKKGIPLFLALLGDTSSTQEVKKKSGGSTGVTVPPGSVVEEVDESTVVIVTPPGKEEGKESSGDNAGSPGSGETSSGDGSSGSGSDQADGSSPDLVVPPVETIIEDETGVPEFTFGTTITIPVNITVRDSSGVVSGANVTILDLSDPSNHDVLFQQITTGNGLAQGSITIPTSLGQVQLNINFGGIIVSITVDTTVLDPSSGQVQFITAITRTVSVGTNVNPPAQLVDSDGDGIEDNLDDYPDDPTRATITRSPKSGVNTLAFEDLFPNAGDADLNDYVLFYNYEEDLNAKGEIVEIRGYFQHVAKGAGYRHTLNLRLNVPTGAKFDAVISKNRNNNTSQESISGGTFTAEQLAAGIELLEESSKTISTPNSIASHANNLKFGDEIQFSLAFDRPVTRAQLGNAPYDIYAYVVNTKKEVHLPNRYFDSAGKDIYLDQTGFPWAVIVPGKWKWQLESHDIRKPSQTGYADFNVWASSRGLEKREWYKNVTDPSKVFPLPDESNLAGFLAKTVESHWLLLSLGLLIIGLPAGYFFTRKNHKALSA
jgi:LruC domain-containing protein